VSVKFFEKEMRIPKRFLRLRQSFYVFSTFYVIIRVLQKIKEDITKLCFVDLGWPI